ncbi:hypothetical protein AVEN_229681-1 [Araneus ventricosus]|uniref:Uncharacterized protein n=1 Tax=Araneus ventricosus TaxID=182803 RepID=A0A4Y2UIV1_ARAVE|nr:hypothetical protein AVEN_229681-1 [Araneus ventricosus]
MRESLEEATPAGFPDSTHLKIGFCVPPNGPSSTPRGTRTTGWEPLMYMMYNVLAYEEAAPNFEQEWLKRVANNLFSRQKIRGIIKFISENRDLFRPP